MPYITEEKRERLQVGLAVLLFGIEELRDEDPSSLAGVLNYVFTRLCLDTLPRNPCYNDWNTVIGVLESCKLEMYRKKVSPYEDLKEGLNGEI